MESRVAYTHSEPADIRKNCVDLGTNAIPVRVYMVTSGGSRINQEDWQGNVCYNSHLRESQVRAHCANMSTSTYHGVCYAE